MPESYLGLCCTCDHALTCVYRAVAGNPVLECEEFVASPASTPALPEDVSRIVDNPQQDDNRFRGLCYDCENRKSCDFVRTVEGGVLHCEEYR